MLLKWSVRPLASPYTVDCILQAPAQPPPTANDAQAEKALREMFKKISGEDLEVDAYELQDILNTAFWKGIGPLAHN